MDIVRDFALGAIHHRRFSGAAFSKFEMMWTACSYVFIKRIYQGATKLKTGDGCRYVDVYQYFAYPDGKYKSSMGFNVDPHQTFSKSCPVSAVS
jgi:hypothetical protein